MLVRLLMRNTAYSHPGADIRRGINYLEQGSVIRTEARIRGCYSRYKKKVFIVCHICVDCGGVGHYFTSILGVLVSGFVDSADGWGISGFNADFWYVSGPTGLFMDKAISIYYSRGFGGWVSARSRTTHLWGAPWRALGPSPCAAVPLTILWTAAIGAHIAMLAFCIRSLMNVGCASTTCIGVASAQLALSIMTLAAAVYMLQLDLRFDASLSPPAPPRQSDTHICTAVSMVPLTSVAINSGNSEAADPAGSPLGKEAKEKEPPPLEPPT